MVWTKAELRDFAFYLGMRSLPVDWCSALGARLGQGQAGRLSRPEAEARGRAAMALLRPDLAAADRIEATMTALWGNIGRTFSEFSVLPKLIALGRSRIGDPDRLGALLVDPRPLIFAFVHLGNWEIVGAQVGLHPAFRNKRRGSGVIMPPNNRAHARIVQLQRAHLPAELIPMDAHLWRRITEVLSQPNGTAWLAADELVGGVVMAPHFGRKLKPHGNMGKIIRLAAATGARIQPVYSERLTGAHFLFHMLPTVEVPRGRLSPEALLAEVARLDAMFAPVVRAHLDQWLWTVDLVSTHDDPITG